jgi:multiple sugar transport system substrate-binding protein
VAENCLVPLDEWIPREFLVEQQTNSLGDSFTSYVWNQHVWALAIDAAAHVMAYRPDLIRHCPNQWDEIIALVDDTCHDTSKVAMPLIPVDAFCAFASWSANAGVPLFSQDGQVIERSVGVTLLEQFGCFARNLHPLSFHKDPPALLDWMAESDEIQLVPLVFGYSNYARLGFRDHLIAFTNIPDHGFGPVGAILGGVGLAISKRSSHVQEAADYAQFVASPTIQQGLYWNSGGQPGFASAWHDKEANTQCHDFFEATCETLRQSWLRPRFRGFVRVQTQLGIILNTWLQADHGNAKKAIDAMNASYTSMLKSMA